MITRFEAGPLAGQIKPSVPLGEAPSSIWGRLVSTAGNGGSLDFSKEALAHRFNHRGATSAKSPPPAVHIPALSALLDEPQPAAPSAPSTKHTLT
jgi:hypothetical protein